MTDMTDMTLKLSIALKFKDSIYFKYEPLSIYEKNKNLYIKPLLKQSKKIKKEKFEELLKLHNNESMMIYNKIKAVGVIDLTDAANENNFWNNFYNNI